MTQPAAKRLVLAGAGHAHLYTLQRLAEFTRRGYEVVVIAPDDFWYSGLATGVLGGHYAVEEDQVDIGRLIRQGGGTWRRERLLGIDPAARSLRLESGVLTFDVLSLNLGSETRPLAGEDERVFPIKPLPHLWRLRERLETARVAKQSLRVVIAGGGASGCEIAANVRAVAGPEAQVTVVAHGRTLASTFAPAASRTLKRWLEAHGVVLKMETSVSYVEDGVAVAEQGDRFPFDYLVNATGLYPPPIIAHSGLPVSERGEMRVDRFLRSTADERVFGGGDCICFAERPLAKVGVYAIRESPVLFHNLLATLECRPLHMFKPQKHFLLILNLGDGYALAHWRKWHWAGRAAFWLKQWIDRKFVIRSRKPEAAGDCRGF